MTNLAYRETNAEFGGMKQMSNSGDHSFFLQLLMDWNFVKPVRQRATASVVVASLLMLSSSFPTIARAQSAPVDSTVRAERIIFAKLKHAMLVNDHAAVAAIGIYPLIVNKGVSGKIIIATPSRLVQWYDLIITNRIRNAVQKQNSDSLRLVGGALSTRGGELFVGTRCDDEGKRCTVGIVAINLFSVAAK